MTSRPSPQPSFPLGTLRRVPLPVERVLELHPHTRAGAALDHRTQGQERRADALTPAAEVGHLSALRDRAASTADERRACSLGGRGFVGRYVFHSNKLPCRAQGREVR